MGKYSPEIDILKCQVTLFPGALPKCLKCAVYFNRFNFKVDTREVLL